MYRNRIEYTGFFIVPVCFAS